MQIQRPHATICSRRSVTVAPQVVAGWWSGQPAAGRWSYPGRATAGRTGGARWLTDWRAASQSTPGTTASVHYWLPRTRRTRSTFSRLLIHASATTRAIGALAAPWRHVSFDPARQRLHNNSRAHTASFSSWSLSLTARHRLTLFYSTVLNNYVIVLPLATIPLVHVISPSLQTDLRDDLMGKIIGAATIFFKISTSRLLIDYI